jgi:hypothetical protein
VVGNEETTLDPSLRERAVRRLKKKRDLQAHLLAYALVNTFIVIVWAATGAHFFWPIFVIVGWGIGLVMNVWDVYRSGEPTEERIREEMDHLRREA